MTEIDAIQAVTRLVRKIRPDESYVTPAVAKMKAALNRAGYDASDYDIKWAWEMHSDDWSATWLCVESCGDAVQAVKYLLEYLVPE